MCQESVERMICVLPVWIAIFLGVFFQSEVKQQQKKNESGTAVMCVGVF